MKEKLQQFIQDELIFVDANQFDSSTDLFAHGLDSMGIMRLVLFIEEEFQVQLPDAEVVPEKLQNVDLICAWIEELS